MAEPTLAPFPVEMATPLVAAAATAGVLVTAVAFSLVMAGRTAVALLTKRSR